jgi:methionyl aminopeptidase
MSIVCGTASSKQTNLLKATREARRKAIEAAQPDRPVKDIAEAVEAVAARYGVGIIDNLGGHGVGNFIHEAPYISNVSRYAETHILRAGEVIAIEPILSYQNGSVLKSGRWHLDSPTQSAQAEHTVIIGTPTRIIT